MKKILKRIFGIVVVLALCVSANANVLPGTMRLYWRDLSGAPNDSRVDAAPGETVFIQLMVNSTSNQGNGVNYFLNADWDIAVVDTTMVPGGYVTVDVASYMMPRDYQSTSYQGNEIVTYGGSFDTLNIDYNGPSNLYMYQIFNGGDPGGVPIEGYSVADYLSAFGSGGIVAGFWVPIRSDAVVGSTTRFDVNVTSSGPWGGGGWSSALTEAGNEHGTDWLSAGQADFSMIITVVPEPATMGLLALGGIAALIRRKRK